jgi:NAD(P)H-hydrate epimerase
MVQAVSPARVRALFRPARDSHKGQNGVLLIVAGSKQYHGSAVLATLTATKFVDLVYFSSVPQNNALIKKLKLATACIITVPRASLKKWLPACDAVLVGPGLGRGKQERALVKSLLHSGKKLVLDADALRVITPGELNENCLVTPHPGEFLALFGESPSAKNVPALAKKYGCTILAKGILGAKGKRADAIASFDGKTAFSSGGNAGMTKGGTGDVLAGLCAAFACKNPLFISACAAAYLNGKAGELCHKKYRFAYSAEDLVGEVQIAYAKSL